MKTETFEKAQELSLKINDCELAIRNLEENKKDHNGYPFNINFSYDTMYEEVKQNSIRFIKTKLANLKKEFSNLK